MRNLLVAGCLTAFAVATLVAQHTPAEKFVVHEWGTFLAMAGSDGVTLDGMYHEEHALPSFVHARGRNELRLPASNIKGETPVIYFYSDVERRVRVEVGFPGGLWTQWYPQASTLSPTLLQTGTLPAMRNGRISWTVDVGPAAGTPPRLPATEADALWNHARDVDAAYVRAAADPREQNGAREWERFIFYRGLGDAHLPLEVSATGGARATCEGMPGPSDPAYGPSDQASGGAALRNVYVLRVERGRGVYRYLPSLGCGERIEQVVPAMDAAKPLDTFVPSIAADLTRRLVASGLYEKEARAMTNTWRDSYFATDGVRVLFVLPQAWTDRFIPMTISPKPDELVRVMVGRIEVLTRERERAIEDAIAQLSSSDADVRERAFAMLRAQGRYVEPLVRRTLSSTRDERVRALCRRLLLTDFVTDLRTSLTDAATGRAVVREPVFTRAQLASLLREIGLEQEAREEGGRALAELARMAPPSLDDHTARDRYRALARAYEGAGRDAEALRWYSDFVEFGAGFRSCSGCHSLAGPRDASFFRDWWAGQRYAELAARTGAAARLIEAHEAALRRAPDDFLTQLRLAYLYERQGDAGRAGQIWARIAPGSGPQRAALR